MARTGNGPFRGTAGARHAPWRRRRTARLALAAALLCAAPVAGAAGPDDREVAVVVTGDLPAGHELGGSDLDTVALPRDAVPDGVFTSTGEAAGARLASPARRGEPLTDARVHRGARGGPDHRVVAVPLADPAVASVLAPGDLVDLVAPAADDGGPAAGPPTSGRAPSPPRLVAESAVVVEVPRPGLGAGGVLLVSVPAPRAAELASAASGTALGVLVHR